LYGLQANPIFGYSFYSFPYSLDFRVKRYQWYPSAWSISRCISSCHQGLRVRLLEEHVEQDCPERHQFMSA
jgi:hypothetical protein